MKFGKLYDLRGVDLSLPDDHPRTRRVLAESGRKAGEKPRIYLGATGWSNREWVGNYYPAGTKPADYLRHYSRQFNTIEFNTTHYRIPDSELVYRWYTGAGPGFKFCPKIPQQISHRARLSAEDATNRFVAAISGLQEKLGPTFLQLPDYHGPDAGRSVLQYLKDWPQELGLHWELRNPDWFVAENAAADRIYDALEGAGQGMVITDVAGRRDVLHMQLTNAVLVLRFVGNGLHATDYLRADAWAGRLGEWCEMGLREAYIFIHQPEMEQVPAYTAYWAEALLRTTGVQTAVPKIIEEGRQGSLF